MNILRVLLDICLLRGRPQDLPTSTTLLALAAGAGITVDTFSISGSGFEFRNLVLAVIQTVLFGGGLYLILQWRNFTARWIQVATALFAVNAVFSLLVFPLTPALQEMIKADPQASLGWAPMVAFGLSIWFLTVTARVLREALETTLVVGFGIGLLLMIGVFIAGSMLAATLGLYGQS